MNDDAPDVGARMRVLVIDDQPDIRLMCRVNLALEGFLVSEAADGESGLGRAREESPDVILLDVMMPGLDGWEVLAALKSDPATRDIPVVMLTARVQREDEIRGWSTGAADYVSKPFNPSTLKQVIGGVLRADDVERRREQAIAKLTIL